MNYITRYFKNGCVIFAKKDNKSVNCIYKILLYISKTKIIKLARGEKIKIILFYILLQIY